MKIDRNHAFILVESGQGEAKITWGQLIDFCGGDEEAANELALRITANSSKLLPLLMQLTKQAERQPPGAVP